MPEDYIKPDVYIYSTGVSTPSETPVVTSDEQNYFLNQGNTNSTAYEFDVTNEEAQALLIEEMRLEIERKKQELENSQESRGWLTSAWNWTKGLFGGGDKAKLKEIEELELALSSLEKDPSKIEAVYAQIMGVELDKTRYETQFQVKTLQNSLDEETQNALILELENQVKTLEDELSSVKEQNGWISGSWDWIKNWTGLGASSNKTQQEIKSAKEQIEKLKNGEADLATTYKSITGKDLTVEELTAFANGESNLKNNSKAGEKLANYSEGQKMCTDVVGDIVSGIAAVGVVALGSAIGICAAPFTAGASLGMVAAGIGLAAGTGAVVKTAIKASDCIGNEKKYGLKDFGYDLITGSINGAMGPISNGAAGAVGTGIMKAAGMEALETTAKTAFRVTAGEVVEEVVEESAEVALKSVGRQLFEKGVVVFAKGTNMVADGALSGATDGFARALAEGRFEDIPEEMWYGAKGGAIASPLISTGFSAAGKIGRELGQTAAGKAVSNFVSDSSSKFGGVISDLAHTYTPNLAQGLDNLSSAINDKIAKNVIDNAIVENSDGSLKVTIGDSVINVAKDEIPQEIMRDNAKIYAWLAQGLEDYNNTLASSLMEDVVQEEQVRALSYNPETEEITPARVANEVDVELDHAVAGDNVGVQLVRNPQNCVDMLLELDDVDVLDVESVELLFNSLKSADGNISEVDYKKIEEIFKHFRLEIKDYMYDCPENINQVFEFIADSYKLIGVDNLDNPRIISMLQCIMDDDEYFSAGNLEAIKQIGESLEAQLSGIDTETRLQTVENIICRILKDANGQETQEIIEQIQRLQQVFESKDLQTAVIEIYKNNLPEEQVQIKLLNNITAGKVYDLIKPEGYSKDVFNVYFADVIGELTNRGYTPEQIKIMLQYNHSAFIDRTFIQKPNIVLFADVLELIGNGKLTDLSVLSEYTASAHPFNDALTLPIENLDEMPFVELSDEVNCSFDTAIYNAKILDEVFKHARISHQMKVYRGEGYEVLNSFQLQNGKGLGNSIAEAVASGDDAKIDEIIAEILGGEIVQPRFMSTAYSKTQSELFVKRGEGIGVMWEIDVPEGAKGIYMDPFNSVNEAETEILFARNTRLMIYDACVDQEGIFRIFAKMIK